MSSFDCLLQITPRDEDFKFIFCGLVLEIKF